MLALINIFRPIRTLDISRYGLISTSLGWFSPPIVEGDVCLFRPSGTFEEQEPLLRDADIEEQGLRNYMFSVRFETQAHIFIHTFRSQIQLLEATV